MRPSSWLMVAGMLSTIIFWFDICRDQVTWSSGFIFLIGVASCLIAIKSIKDGH